MKKNPIFSVLCVAAAFVLAWFFMTDADSDSKRAGQINRDEFRGSVSSASVTAAKSSQASTSSSTVIAQQGHVEPIEITEDWPSDVSESFGEAAKAYAETLKSPSYSRPLSAADAQLLKPNAYFPQTIPLEGGGNARIQLERYRYLFPEPVAVRLIVEGMSISDPTLKLFSVVDNALLTSTKMNALTANNFESKLTSEANWNGQLRIEIQFSSQSKSQILQTEFEYSQPVAHITGIGNALVDGPDMVIPVMINVEKSGVYRLNANLFTENKSPLALLTQSQKLPSGKNVLELRAHKSVLQNYSGPYLLNTLQLELRSAAPGQLSQYGTSVAPEFLIPPINLDALADDAYQPSEQELQRLEFLNEMGSST